MSDKYFIFHIIQVCDRSSDSLQSKFKELQKLARQDESETKRDLVQTGNKRLRSRTIDSLRETNILVELRKRLGATGTGFESKHCKQFYFCVYNPNLSAATFQ